MEDLEKIIDDILKEQARRAVIWEYAKAGLIDINDVNINSDELLHELSIKAAIEGFDKLTPAEQIFVATGSVEEYIKALEKPPYIQQSSCQVGWVVGACKDNHHWVKAIYCGVEWCDFCGADYSWLHLRRMARWFKKVLVMKDVGYMVITFPQEIQEKMKDRKELQKIRRYIIRKLKRMGKKRGLVRYHWSGDAKQLKEWFPHLNILFEGKYWNKRKLRNFKKEVKEWLEKEYKIKIKAKNIVIYYQYYRNCSLNKKYHLLAYITRSTMRWKDKELIKNVYYKFHNAVCWGKWDDIDNIIIPYDDRIIELDNIERLDKGECLKCGKEIEWIGFLYLYELNIPYQAEQYGDYVYLGKNFFKGKMINKILRRRYSKRNTYQTYWWMD